MIRGDECGSMWFEIIGVLEQGIPRPLTAATVVRFPLGLPASRAVLTGCHRPFSPVSLSAFSAAFWEGVQQRV